MKTPRSIFISYAREDREKVKGLHEQLKSRGFSPWLDEIDLLPGMDWGSEIRTAIEKSRFFLACISKNTTDKRGYLQKELRIALEHAERFLSGHDISIIPVILEPCEVPSEIRHIHAVHLYEPDGFERLVEGLEYQLKNSVSDEPGSLPERRNLIVSELELENIRCFKTLKIQLAESAHPASWALIIGDNAAGKTTLLRSIALGLCGESEAVSLIQDVPGGFVRRGEKEGRVKLRLIDANKPAERFSITTRIIAGPNETSEIVRKQMSPPDGSFLNDIFVCGYGTNRAFLADASFDGYSAMNAVRTLFDYQASLQNPELVLRRRSTEKRKILEDKLLSLLLLDSPENRLVYTDRGIELTGPWGQEPFSVLSDGYRSTSQWALDFISWMIHADRLADADRAGGILLLDEIEQHLHPRWQRHIVQRLRRQFPTTQIVAASHTPLTASGLADIDGSLLIKLESDEKGGIETKVIDPRSLSGKRADQVLASDAFGLVTSRNPGSEKELDRYAELMGKKKRTKQEESELENLGLHLKAALSSGENKVEQAVENAVDETLKNMLLSVSPQQLSLEAKKQLREIFRPAPKTGQE